MFAYKDDAGDPLISYCVRCGFDKGLRLMVRCGADVNVAHTHTGDTPLHTACNMNSMRMVSE
jgi:ankyrin repeat protein